LTPVAIVHDYLTQRGGAERVVLSMLKAFPTAPLYTSLYQPDGTFPEFRWADVRPLAIDRIPGLRHHHRFALPLLAAAFSNLLVNAEVVLCSSSGWAHGVQTLGRKIVYCYTPARWLYQSEKYLAGPQPFEAAALSSLAPYLRRWDRRAAFSAHRYVTQSSVVRARIRQVYGIDAEILPGPYRLTPEHLQVPVEEVTPGFFLCVSRLLPYKNVGAVIGAFSELPRQHLVIVGDGPQGMALRRIAPANVTFVGAVSDAQLAWLYAHTSGIITAAYEDYGLTPLEAAAFGKPSLVLRWGGFLDTVVEDTTGIFFDSPTPAQIREAVRRFHGRTFNQEAIRAHASRYSEDAFVRRLRAVVASEMPGERAPLEPRPPAVAALG